MQYVISDIHGNKEAFDTIPSLIGLRPEDHLYILGDMIDRGSYDVGLLQQIRTMERNKRYVRGHLFDSVSGI